jgi:hypothetical protein
MACHEIAALRIALHRMLGTRPEQEKSHEYAELGIACTGALKALTEASDLASMRRALDAAGAELDARVAGMKLDDPQLGYYRALVVTVRAVQRQVERILADTERFYLDIEDTHDLLHEVFPGSDLDG